MVYKICMIGTQYIGVPTDSGGAIEYLSFKIAQGLSKKGFSITYFSVNPAIKFNSENLLIERFPAKKTNAFFFTLFVLFKSLFKKFDAVYVSGCSMIFAGLILARLKGIPLIYHEFNHNPWIKPNNPVYDFLARFSVNSSDYVIVASDFIKKAITDQTKVNGTKLKKILNFIDLTEFPFKPAKKENKILFVGRLVKHKGIDFLTELIKKSDFKQWVFEVIAPKACSEEEKNYFKKLNSLSKSNGKKFVLKTNLSRKQLIEEFTSASILLLPSSQEAFGMVLTEAMACFTPCVAFSAGGTKEIIDNNINGFLVEINNKKLFEEKLKELINDREKRVSFGLKARQKIEENFSFDKAIIEFENFFNEILVKK